MDEISDQMAVADEISDAISNPIGGAMEDDDDLLAELDELDEDELADDIMGEVSIPGMGEAAAAPAPAVSTPVLPSAPTGPVASTPAPVRGCSVAAGCGCVAWLGCSLAVLRDTRRPLKTPTWRSWKHWLLAWHDASAPRSIDNNSMQAQIVPEDMFYSQDHKHTHVRAHKRTRLPRRPSPCRHRHETRSTWPQTTHEKPPKGRGGSGYLCPRVAWLADRRAAAARALAMACSRSGIMPVLARRPCFITMAWDARRALASRIRLKLVNQPSMSSWESACMYSMRLLARM